VTRPFLYVATPWKGGEAQIRYLDAVLRLAAACAARGLGFHLELLEDDRVIARARARPMAYTGSVLAALEAGAGRV